MLDLNHKSLLLGTILEASDRKQLETAMRQNGERLQAAVANLPIIIWAIDHEGIFTLSMGKGLEALGLRAGQIVGQSIFDLYKDYGDILENIRLGLGGLDTDWIARIGDIIYETRATPIRDLKGNITGLVGISVDITEIKEAELTLRQQADRERLVNSITQRIHASLDIDDILRTTVTEVRQFLQSDRVVIYRLRSNGNGTVVAEAVDLNYPPTLGMSLGSYWSDENLESYCHGDIDVIHNIGKAALPSNILEEFTQLQIKACLAIPILIDEQFGVSRVSPIAQVYTSKLWGLIVVNQCSRVRYWQLQEINLLGALATQLAIAIHQAQLYKKLEAANRELKYLINLDYLTQVYNRRYFDEYLQQEWRRLLRQQEPMAIIMCDIDYFKNYNDAYGHQEGDRCLQEVAKAIHQALKRPADLVARYGGEEFVLVLPNTDV